MTSSRISDAELELLQILWTEAPLDAAGLATRAPAERGWSLTTVKTLLSRLVAKGAVSARSSGRRYHYSPAVDRDEIARRQAGRLFNSVFGGRLSPLVAHLAEERDLDPDDLDELEQLIRSLRK